MTTNDPDTLTPTELHALQSLLAAVKAGREYEARYWADQAAVQSALAKMKAQAAARKREAS